MGSLRQLFWRQRMERRELMTAAKVIQNAYRLYKRNAQTRQRQLESECKAAVVIQTYYRRYKQYCYSKKLNQAAALIQRQFRLYKSTKRRLDQDSQDNKATDISSAQDQPLIQAFTNFLETTTKSQARTAERRNSAGGDQRGCTSGSDTEHWDAKRQQAAMRIQQAFRGHRKRRAAAAGPAKKLRRCSASSIATKAESASPSAISH